MTDLAECKVSLWIYGDVLDPAKLVALLGCEPEYSITKGDIYVSDNGEEMVASTGRFQITTGWRLRESLDGLIMELLKQVPCDPTLWAEIDSALVADMFCGIILDSVNEEAKIGADTLLALGQRGISLHLDIYDSGDGPLG